MTRWIDPPLVEVPTSFADLNLSLLVAQTLVRRGITNSDSVRAFLHPDTLPSTPFPGIENAVERIITAARSREPICVWGDFDVDGQTSTTLLVQTLQALGAKVIYYIPIRGKESHGVHIESLKPIIDNGARLILTCDTGITAHEATGYANSRGVDVIITDHHDLGETLPSASAIINPKLLPGNHPLANLAGVGVAYKLSEALLEILQSGFGNRESPPDSRITTPDSLLDLVALGLIADMAVLRGETRSLAQKGIQALRETKRAGLKAIAELSETNLSTLTEDTIGFTFAPRLNALGRLSDANPAVELLLTQDPARARLLAAQIEGLNAQRKLLTSQVYEAAQAQLREDPDLLSGPAIILSHPNWPGGVVGIVANKLVGRYHKPALLLTESEDGILRGSARSVEGLHITDAIATQKDRLLGFGGHPMAAGLSIESGKFLEFKKGLGRAIENQLGAAVGEEPTLQIDAWMGLRDLSLDLGIALESLAPYGAGNPPLRLATRGLTIESVREIGRAKDHRRLIVADETGQHQDMLWWNGAGEELPEQGSRVDIAYTLRASSYRGERQLTIQFDELRTVEQVPIEVRTTGMELLDLRAHPSTSDLDPATLIWAEGAEKSKGSNRYELHPADEFAIYTTPPSPAELRKALEIVIPKKVYLLAVPPKEEKNEEFLNRLAGLCKYALNQRGGRVNVQGLAAALAAREAAVRIGLEWLAAGGHVKVQAEADEVTLEAGEGESNPYLQKELFIALKGLLAETAAYRLYFSTADPNHLMSI
jgi:single-stranded-DNA-specific exonuclease